VQHFDYFFVMSSSDIFVRLRNLDAYPKTLEDFRIKTYEGATGKQKTKLQITIVWDVKPCSVVDKYRRFEGTCSLHLQGRNAQAEGFSDCYNYMPSHP
jgi:hypothetical protein